MNRWVDIVFTKDFYGGKSHILGPIFRKGDRHMVKLHADGFIDVVGRFFRAKGYWRKLSPLERLAEVAE